MIIYGLSNAITNFFGKSQKDLCFFQNCSTLKEIKLVNIQERVEINWSNILKGKFVNANKLAIDINKKLGHGKKIISPQTIINLRNNQVPSVKTLVILMDYFGLKSFDELVTIKKNGTT